MGAKLHCDSNSWPEPERTPRTLYARRDIQSRARVTIVLPGREQPARVAGCPIRRIPPPRRRDVQTTTATALLLPPPLAADLSKHTRTEAGTGESGTTVTRFERSTGTPVFLKSRVIDSLPSPRPLFDEAERLGWMHAVGLPVPAVLQYHEWKGREYLLLTAVPGADAAVPRSPDQHGAIVSALAAGLRTLHATNISACPFDHSRRVRVAAVEARVRAGVVREDDFDAVHQGRTARDLYAELVATPPASEDRVFAHGDYCLPNVVLIEDGAGGFRVSGFLDCGNAGIADRYQDLALCARSIAYNFGDALVPTLFARYGLERVDEAKIAYYQLLDEFF
jgi:aminoglycoside 3'-phosphotransferase II